jgi:gluconolactonase
VIEFEELAEGLNHPEGVCWNPVDGAVYAGGEGGEIYRVTLDGEVSLVASTGGSMLGVAADGAGRVYACDEGNGEIVRVEPTTGVVETYIGSVEGRPLDTPNMLAFDPRGVLYVTCSGEDGRPSIVSRAPGETARLWTEAVPGYPNGCLVTPDGDGLVVVEAHAQRLCWVPIHDDGSPGRPDVVAELPDTDPDGVALDAEGAFWVTLYRPDGLARVDMSGRVEVVVEDPLARLFDAPTNLAFAGADLTLAVVANVGDRYLSVADLGVKGQPLHRPEIP